MATTREIVKEKMKELIPDLNEALSKEVDRLLLTNAISLSKYEDKDYVIAKILLVVALENLAEQYMPRINEYRKEIKNLRKF